MEHGGYYLTGAAEVEPLSPSTYRSIMDVVERVARRHDRAGMTYGYRGTVRAPAAENRLYLRRHLDGVTELFDEHGAAVGVDRGDDSPYGGGRFGAVPASEAEIARLPVATAGEVRESDCGVCHERFEHGEGLRKMTCPCSHGFHESCILKWLRVSRLFPLCRFALLAEHEERRTATEPEVEETNAAAMVEPVAAEETCMEGDHTREQR